MVKVVVFLLALALIVVAPAMALTNDQTNINFEARYVPYASIGISSPDGTTGISYTFNNRRPVTSAPIEDERALLFSTSPRYRAGDLYGVVRDHEDASPVEGAIITTQHGFTGISDAEGNWRIDDALAEIEFDLTCIKQGYNDSTKFALLVGEEEELEVNFDLLHPEFTPSTYRLTRMLDPGLEAKMRFSLENTGNGPMNWKVERRLLGDANAEPWEFRRSYYVGEDVEDTRIQAVVFINHHFYVSGAGDEMPMIYKFDREGALVDTFPQPREDNRGIRDLTWDGELLWGAIDDSVYGFTLEGEVMTRWESDYNPTTNIAFDPDREAIWLSSITTDPIAYTREGERIDSLEIDRQDLRIYSLIYWTEDPDGHPLYVYHKDRETNLTMLHKIDPETNDTMHVATLVHEINGSPEGGCFTNQFDVYSWVFAGVSSASNRDGGDRIDIWQMEARKDWFQLDAIRNDEYVEADSGRLETGESEDFVLTLISEGLPDTLFQGELFFQHNADSGRGRIFVDLDVIGAMPPEAFGLLAPANNDTLDSTAVEFIWEESVEHNHDDTLSYYFWIKSGEDSVSIVLQDTTLMVDVDTLAWEYDPAEPFTWWTVVESGEDLVESDERFTFRLKPPNLLNDPLAGIPVEFTIHSLHPNPFNSTTKIVFGADRSAHTTLKAYDLRGREAARIYSGVPSTGYHQVIWNAQDLPSGIYLIRLESDRRVKIVKSTLVK